MTEQQRKELEYLRHVVLNNLLGIKALCAQVEESIKTITSAVDNYIKTWEEDGHDTDL